MTELLALTILWDTYMNAVNAHAEAASVLNTHFMARTRPTAVEVQRAADARVIMAGARTAYYAARDT
jgi:hypothetical protein